MNDIPNTMKNYVQKSIESLFINNDNNNSTYFYKLIKIRCFLNTLEKDTFFLNTIITFNENILWMKFTFKLKFLKIIVLKIKIVKF